MQQALDDVVGSAAAAKAVGFAAGVAAVGEAADGPTVGLAAADPSVVEATDLGVGSDVAPSPDSASASMPAVNAAAAAVDAAALGDDEVAQMTAVNAAAAAVNAAAAGAVGPSRQPGTGSRAYLVTLDEEIERLRGLVAEARSSMVAERAAVGVSSPRASRSYSQVAQAGPGLQRQSSEHIGSSAALSPSGAASQHRVRAGGVQARVPRGRTRSPDRGHRSDGGPNWAGGGSGWSRGWHRGGGSGWRW
jgi:hypothetical protein